MSKIIGIDLGTTNSLVAVWENGKTVLIPNSFGEYLTPSVVSVDEKGNLFVGKVAKERLITCPENTASVFKRFMGTGSGYVLGGNRYLPEELSAMVLRRLKQDAESYLGEPVEEAVVSVPAYFNNAARSATKRAGELAGLKVERIVNEPSAAALACYDMHNECTMLVFDFGGGTLDVSLVECFENVVEIIAVSGDNRLGGSDFDDVLTGHFIRQRSLDYYKLTDEQRAIIRQASERCKRELTENESAEIIVNDASIQGSVSISRRELIQLSADLFRRMEVPVQKVLKDSGMGLDEIDDVILVGGSCKMPIVQKYLGHILRRDDIQIRNPDYMIAQGLGVYVGIKERKEEIKDMVLTDICPFSLGVGVINHEDSTAGQVMSVLIPRNTSLPVSHMGEYITVRDNQEYLDIEIYQGEAHLVKHNLYLDEISIKVPPLPAGQAQVDVRFSYDINGVLQVKAKAHNFGEEKELIIVKDKAGLTEDEIAKKLEEFQKLELLNAEEEENNYIFNWGMRLMEQCPEAMRQDIEQRMDYFAHVVGEGITNRITQVKRHLRRYFTKMDRYLDTHNIFAKPDIDFASWYEGEEEENLYEQGEKGYVGFGEDSDAFSQDEAEKEYQEWLRSMGL